jgi:hypothetical protein
MSAPLGDEVPGAPPGARANAVPPPAAWAALEDVDARVAQPLLDALEDADVAAYAERVADGTDRLYVDAHRRDVAAGLVAAELPGLLAELAPGDVVEEVDPFDAIVAGWDAVPEAPTWPASEDVRPAVREPDVGPPRSMPKAAKVDPHEHYVPPPPPPAPPAHAATRWAVLAIAAGLFVLVGLPLLGTMPSHPASVLGAIAIIGGLGTLIWRMRDAPSVDDGPDDGAVV